MVTVTDKGNYVEINRGEPSRRYVVKPFDVDICGTEIISMGDGLKNKWEFNIADLTGWTYTDIYDLKDQLVALNNKYQVDATVTIDTAGLATEDKQDDQIVIEGDIRDNIGATNEAVAPSDTATSGLNGLFKRLLQRFTTLLSVLPTSLGQKSSADSLPTVLSIEQEQGIFAQNTFGSTGSSLPFVSATTSSVTLFGANANRKEIYIRNSSNSALYIRLAGLVATTGSPIKLEKDEILIEDRYLGEIRGIWDSPASSGGAYMMEVGL